MALQIQSVVYKRGLEGKSCPKYVTKGSLLYKNYEQGVKQRKKNENKI